MRVLKGGVTLVTLLFCLSIHANAAEEMALTSEELSVSMEEMSAASEEMISVTEDAVVYDAIALTGTMGINNGINWSYDEGTKTLTLSGEDYLSSWGNFKLSEEFEQSTYPMEQVVFNDCVLNGSIDGMFYGMTGLLTVDASGLDTSQVTDMGWMFYGCSSLTSLDVSSFDTSQVTDMGWMFYGCSSLTSLDVSGFDTSQVTDVSSMFYKCSSLTSLDVSGFDTSQVKYMYYMFYGCSSLTSLDVSGFDTSRVPNVSWMFYGCSSLTSLDVRGFDTSQITTMSSMFSGCSSLTSLDVGGFDTSQVTNMANMFSNCRELRSLDVSGFDTSRITNMSAMFYGCSSLTSLNVSGFDTSQVTNMSAMFYGCSSLTSLDLSNFDLSNLQTASNMLFVCKPDVLYTPNSLNVSIALGCKYISAGNIYSELNADNVGMRLRRYYKVEDKFEDVIAGAWYVPYIQYVWDWEIMSGTGKTTFSPDDVMTRAQFVTVLYNYTGRPTVTFDAIFDDVASWDYFALPVIWAHENNVTSGVSANNFGSQTEITREQIAVMLYKYAALQGVNTTYEVTAIDAFPDSNQVHDWAEEAMKWAVSQGVMSGKGTAEEVYLDPCGAATRAECATMIKNYSEIQ